MEIDDLVILFFLLGTIELAGTVFVLGALPLPFDGGLHLRRALFNLLLTRLLRYHRVQLQSLLVQPLPLFLQEIRVANKHSSDLT